MKSKMLPLLAAVLAAAAMAPVSGAEKEIKLRKIVEGDAPPGHFGPHRALRVKAGDAKVEKEKVAFLGVQTAPVQRTLAAQLGLPRGTGLVVTDVVEDSPAATTLQQDDILTKLDDQILIGQQQLSVLIRNKKEGDEVTLTVYRGGKETRIKVKLGQREVPKMAAFGFEEAGDGPDFHFFNMEGPQIAQLHQLPGMEPGRVNDVIRMIGRNRGNFMGTPGVQILRRGDQGATILDLPQGSVVYSDEQGSVEVRAEDGKRDLTVKDAKGAVVFQGPVNSKEDREKLPAEVKERLGKIEGANFSFEVGEGFEAEGADIRPAAGLRRIGLPPRGAVRVPRHDPRFF